jgi:hypothetical protein
VPFPLVREPRQRLDTNTMEVHTSEIEGSVDIVLSDSDILDEPEDPIVSTARPVVYAPNRIAPQVRAPVHGMSILVTVLTITLLGFALALSLVLALR